MAVGGVTVVGASTAMSRVAFASAGSTTCAGSGSVAITYSTTGNSATISVAVTNVACPCPAGVPSSPQVSYLLNSPPYNSLLGVTSWTNTLVIPMPNNPPGGYPMTRSWTVIVTVQCLDGNGQPVCATFLANGTVTKTANGNASTFSPSTPASGSVSYSAGPCV